MAARLPDTEAGWMHYWDLGLGNGPGPSETCNESNGRGMSKTLECDRCENVFKWSSKNEEAVRFCPACGEPWHDGPKWEPDVFHPHVLAQDQIWIDKYGKEHIIDEMPRSYIANVLGMLLRTPGHYRRIYTERDTFRLEVTLGYHPSRNWGRTSILGKEQDNSWITRSPLVRRLMGELIG